jgi:hypothetical protein
MDTHYIGAIVLDGAAVVWQCTFDQNCSLRNGSVLLMKYEVLWVCIGAAFMAAIYHPPKPQYRTELLLQYIDLCVETINNRYPGAQIIIGGDTNQLFENDIIERTG